MDGFPELEIWTEPECKGDIYEKNWPTNPRPVDTFIRGNPCTCEGITQPGFRLAALCGRIRDDKGILSGYIQIKRVNGFTSDLARL
jgi:hypothetical protein